jgi:2-polyprenyl-3-methyl-5-hydroxy-6-metoxy-1,4-benzoquinol methylase
MAQKSSTIRGYMCCPVCETPVTGPPLTRYTATEAARHFCPETRDQDRNARLQRSIRKLWQREECIILRCQRCRFMFGYPYVGGDEEFYSILHEQQDYPRWRFEYEIALDLSKKVPPHEEVQALDIGAGIGAFLDHLDERWRPFAVEGSETTRQLLQRKGLTVFDRLLDIPDEQFGRFRLITLFQVLEHVAPFADTLTTCRRLIHPEGRLVISVPDGDAMLEQEAVIGCADMPPNHINKWTSGSLALALERANFKVENTIAERPSWSTVRHGLHMRILADATRRTTLAAHVYRLKSRSARIPLLALLAVPAAVKLLPSWRYFLRGGSFVVSARPS